MEEEKVVQIFGSITVDELAAALNISVTTLIGELFKNGIVATINQRIDFETATIIVEELGIGAKLEKKSATESGAAQEKHQLSEDAVTRPPIVAIMGHVDHGKTTLLDTLLSKKTVDTEAGGITQHISAYQIKHGDRPITFLDTPGHEAFAALRQHSATLTDIVVLVVAADDGVKPQTAEAIKFAQSANAGIIVAINKIDKETADVNRVMAQLATDQGLNPEEWGGNTIMVPVSAKTGEGLDKLLDMIFLVADIEDLRADIGIPAEGLVIESHMEVGKGSIASLLVEQGDLARGDFVVAGKAYGKVRTIEDYLGGAVDKAGPSTPVTMTGFKELPNFGDRFKVVKNEKTAKKLAEQAAAILEKEMAVTNVTGSDMLKMISQEHDVKTFNVVVKADVLGSLTSVIDSLRLIDTKGEVKLSVIGSGVGNISENDIRLAAGENTVVYGFNVDLPPSIKRLAARSDVEVCLFKVIYELLDDAKAHMEKLLAPEVIETELGELVIKGVFRTIKEEIIAGGEVTKGKVVPGVVARVIRGEDEVAEVEVTTVQHEKHQVQSAIEGEMCGLSLKTAKKVLLEVGDKLVFIEREIKQKKL
ncbi:MAG: translation initiation factor IF-2 [Candidatus Nomurabacteria bacterium]|jgi:translation initiation factor IF-2|nr:translation initiation factor IF-2 [Candidatus Nomurabacteria bacterium]